MQGTVRRRGNAWQAIFNVRDSATGRRRQVSATRPTKAEAERWLRTAITEHGTGGGRAFSMTVAELLDAFYDQRSHDWSPSNRRFMRSAIDNTLKPRFGGTPVLGLHASDLEAWYRSLRPRLKASSVRKYHNILSAAYRMAERYGWVATSPVRNAQPPRVERSAVTVPTLDELLVLSDACERHDLRLGFAVHLAALTGARRSEIMAFRWCDFDEDARQLRIWNALVLGDGDKPVLKQGTKTGGRRTVALDDWTLGRLHAYRDARTALVREAGGHLGDDHFLFTLGVDGTEPMSPDYLSKLYERARASVGLKRIRFHDLRHFHATTLLTKGVDVSTVAGRLGHADGGRITLQTYSHFIESADRRAAEIAAGQIRGRGAPGSEAA